MEDFLVVSVVLLSIHHFLALAVRSSKSSGEEGLRDKNVCVDNGICDTVWIRGFFPVNSRLQTEKKEENELEGEGLEDCMFSVRFVPADSFRAMALSTRTLPFLSFLNPS